MSNHSNPKQSIIQYKKAFDEFVFKFNAIINKYHQSQDTKAFSNELQELASAFSTHLGASITFTETGNDYYNKGDFEKGVILFEILAETFQTPTDDLTVFLRKAQYYFENDEEEKGVSYLLKLCAVLPDNYEDCFEFRNLSGVWKKYCHFVKDKIPASKSLDKPYIGYSPEECSMQIADILQLPKDDLLTAIAEHLDELSGYGDEIHNLNKWEQVVYDVNTLYSAIGSDGIDFYLETYGHRFSKVKEALKAVNAKKSLEFFEILENDMPEEAYRFYDEEWIEKELVNAEYKFILKNKERFH